jgi:carbonic anhydrase
VKPLFQYEEVDPNEESEDTDPVKKTLKLEYSDWALRLKYKSLGRIVTLDGAVFAATELVFHTPAEHTIEGKRYDMEMQIIHQGQTKGDIARQVVLSFLFEKKAGIQNKFIDDLDFFDLPNPLHKAKTLSRSININKLFYSVKDNEYPMLRPFSFYTYQGSLTAPPCLENTIVYVASKPISIGTTALQMFQEVSRIPDQISSTGSVQITKFNPLNSRATQPLNGRAVFFFDHIKHCGPDPVKGKGKEVGHFEKVIRKKTDYFFVPGDSPSGLPGAFVVPNKEAGAK